MNRVSFNDLAQTRDNELPLQAVVFYEDVPAAQYAKRAIDIFSEQLEGNSRVKPTFWRLDIADMPPLRSIVTSDLRRADLLVIAADNAAERAILILNTFLADDYSKGNTPDVLLIDLNEQTMHDIAAGHPECLRQFLPTFKNPDQHSGWSLRSCG
ncbi:MAG: hypothetical protein WD490_10025 [Opitutales bacterium]